jgi:hypothetical protein
MFKAFAMIKRKPGTTMEQLIAHYESSHAPLAVKSVPNLKKYVRHFIRPYGNDVYSLDNELPYDVVTEIWFDDREDFERGMAHLIEPETAVAIAEDEDRLFDRSSIRFVTVEDRETELGHGYTSQS